MSAVPKTALATCVKNEGPYLLEWIAWQKMCGFNEIVIYDNNSTDNSRELLRRLSDAGHIIFREAPDDPAVAPQFYAFTAELKRDTDAEWVMFADADEFLVLRNDATIGQFLSKISPEISQVCFNWRIFGSGGHLTASPELVIERFTMAAREDRLVNRHVKAVTRRRHIELPTVHAPVLKTGTSVHDDMVKTSLIHNGLADRVSYKSAFLNHYIVKSRQEFQAKIERGRGALPIGAAQKKRDDPEKFWLGHNLNDQECLIAKSRVSQVRPIIQLLEAVVR